MRDFARNASPQLFAAAALALVGLLLVSTVGVAEDKEDPTAPETIWKSFVEHLESIGRADLIPETSVVEPKDDEKGGDKAGGETEKVEVEVDVHDEDGDHDHDHAAEVPPASVGAGGDPIGPIVHQLSKELALLQALFEDTNDPLLRSLPAEDRPANVNKLLKALETEKDPFVRAYGRLYEAQAALEKSGARQAITTLKKLDDSRFFLGHKEAHLLRARAYRAVGDDSLALLELRLFALELDDNDIVERAWVEEQVAEIRQTNVGPLRESAQDARSVSILIEQRSLGEETREGQEHVEELLDRALKLLGEPKEKACCKAGAAGKPCEASCQTRQTKLGLTGQRRVEGILDGIIDLLESSCKACNAKANSKCQACKKNTACKKCKACKSCGTGPGQKGQGQKLAGQNPNQKKKPGDPTKLKPEDTPASDTKFPRGKPGEKSLRDADYASKEIWGQINDREVARSLRELWGKIPVAYRGLVAQYFLDITDLTPESSK